MQTMSREDPGPGRVTLSRTPHRPPGALCLALGAEAPRGAEPSLLRESPGGSGRRRGRSPIPEELGAQSLRKTQLSHRRAGRQTLSQAAPRL